MSEFRIYDVPRDMVTDFWSAIEPMISRAMEHHPYLQAGGVLWMLNQDLARLFIMTESRKITAACVMSRDQYPCADGTPLAVANVIAFAGDYGVYRNHVDEIDNHMTAWARTHGCRKIGFVGRPGWTRYVLRRGGKLLPLVHASRSLEG